MILLQRQHSTVYVKCPQFSGKIRIKRIIKCKMKYLWQKWNQTTLNSFNNMNIHPKTWIISGTDLTRWILPSMETQPRKCMKLLVHLKHYIFYIVNRYSRILLENCFYCIAWDQPPILPLNQVKFAKFLTSQIPLAYR